MAKPVKRHLKVGTSPEGDESELVIRMHPDDMPKGIRWNNYIHLLVRDARITCRVRNNEVTEVPQPRVHQININKDLREALGLQAGKVYDFYVRKASFWKAPAYVVRYHPSRSARRWTLAKALAALAAGIVICSGLIYFFVAS